jgi:RNA polymerase-binding transcription factor DksA
MNGKLQALRQEVMGNQCQKILERKEKILALIEKLENCLGKFREARTIAEDLIDLLRKIESKVPEIQGFDPSQRSTDNGGQDCALFEESLGSLRVLVAALDRLLQWDPQKLCASCGKNIEPERLGIFPDTTLCAKCANSVPKRRRRK